MKKILFYLFAMVASCAIILTSCSKKEEAPAPIEDSVFVYVNLNQLIQKGAFEEFITPDNRRLVATAISSQIENIEYAEALSSIVQDLNTTGIDLSGIAYAYLCDDLKSLAIVANILDTAQLNSTISLLSYLLVESGEDALDIRVSGDINTFNYNDATVAYNDSRIAIILSNDENSENFAVEAITRAKSDTSIFGTDDIAMLINYERLISLANSEIEIRTTELNNQLDKGEISHTDYTEDVEWVNRLREIVDSYQSSFSAGAKSIISANFDQGIAKLSCRNEGINYGEYATLFKSTNSTHLANLSSDAYAVMGLGVNGNTLSEFVRTRLSKEFLSSIGINPTNELNMILSIACDALSTVDGGVTLALDSIDGKIKRSYNYYWDEYSTTPEIKSIEAMLMVDVMDTYIINNIAQFAGMFLKKVDPMHYTLRLMNYNLSMGQDNNLLHLGVNMTPKGQTPSALDSLWAKDVEGSIGYIAVNIDALAGSEFMRSINKIITSNIIKEYQPIYTNSMEAVEYIYASAESLDFVEIAVVFNDKSTNALKQINKIVLPVVVNQAIKGLI